MRGRKTQLCLTLSAQERHSLECLTRRTAMPFGLGRRILVILALAEGRYAISEIAHCFALHRRHVYVWAQRWQQEGLAGLRDRPGRGKGRKKKEATRE